MVRMVQSRLPDVGVPVMGEFCRISHNRALIHLPEFDMMATMRLNKRAVYTDALSLRIEPPVVGRIEPMVVVSSLRSVRGIVRRAPLIPSVRGRKRRLIWVWRGWKRRVVVSRDVSVVDIYSCEAKFALRSYVRWVLAVVSNRTGLDLEQIYTFLGWPESVESLEFVLPSIWIAVPRLVREGLTECLRVMKLFLWTIQNPFLVAPTWRYPNGWCWAVAHIRQFEALLKKNKLLKEHVFLSVQDLVNIIHTRGDLGPEGDIESLEVIRDGLLSGVTTEQFCPLGSGQRLPGAPIYRLKEYTVHYDFDVSAELWDQRIDDQLDDSPFAASVLWFNSYIDTKAKVEMYIPNQVEQVEYARDPESRHLSAHTMVLSGRGVDENGVGFLVFQDTTGGDIDNGDRGYLRFGRYNPCPVIEMVWMSLLPASEYPPVN